VYRTRKYIQDYSLKKLPHSIGSFDEQGIPLYDPSNMGLGKELCYHPTVIIQYALACFEKIEQNQKYHHQFLSSAIWLENNTNEIGKTGMLGWSIPFSIRTPQIEAPWFSALTQSQGISVLIRLYELEMREETLATLKLLVKPLITNITMGGMLYKDEKGNSFFEEAGNIHILNGCLTSLYGLQEFLSIERDEQLRKVCKDVQNTIEKWLPEFDTGYWSKYSIGLRFNISDLHYHQLHIKQLNELGFILQSPIFLNYARKWNAYLGSNSTILKFIAGRWLITNIGRTLTVLGLNKLKFKNKAK
jgi:hypothetical protein